MRWVILACLALAGCDNASRICSTPQAEEYAIKPLVDIRSRPVGERAAIRRIYIENCVHKWAYRLAGGSDRAEAAAEAAVGACWGALEYLNAADLDVERDLAQKAGVSFDGEPRLLVKTGAWATIARANYEWVYSQAVFRVLQARSGKCAIPA